MTSPVNSPGSSRAVRFSTWSEMASIPKVDKHSDVWYTKEDTNGFKRDLLIESRRMSRLLATTPLGMIPQDTLNELNGLESLVNLEMLRAIQIKKRQHVHGIVSMQRFCNEDELCILSKESSSWARDGAMRRAARV